MEEYIKKIEQIAARCTESQSDGYSQIMKICDAMREEQEERDYENGLKSAIQKMLLKNMPKKEIKYYLDVTDRQIEEAEEELCVKQQSIRGDLDIPGLFFLAFLFTVPYFQNTEKVRRNTMYCRKCGAEIGDNDKFCSV